MFSVIFDMDGTLLDTQRIAVPAWDYAGQLQGYENLGRLIPSVCGMNEAGWNKVLAENAPDIDVALFNETARQYSHKHRVMKEKEGMFELLDFLRAHGVKMAVASGSKTSSIERNFGQLNALDYFEATVGGEMVVNGKPAPDIFLLAAEKIGADPKDCIVFEDSENGLRAALAAGMRAISVPDVGIISDEIKAQLLASVDKLSDAIKILEKLL